MLFLLYNGLPAPTALRLQMQEIADHMEMTFHLNLAAPLTPMSLLPRLGWWKKIVLKRR